MKNFKRWAIFAIVFVVLATRAAAVAPFKKVSIATSTTSATSSTTSTEAAPAEAAETKSENSTSSGPTKNPKLTGIPQIDYIWDPNLPRELRGFNLSKYPFFSSVPPEEDITFKCDGLHDGFYASIEHKCQLYHHCVYGIRHDFLCANFTAFDQKTFICHFVSDVDCDGSQKYWNRNDDLYMATTTTSTTTTTTEPPPTQPRRRPVRPYRPLRRPINRRPADEYYYDDEEYADDDYYEERLNQRRKQRPRHRKPHLEYDDEYDEKRSFSDEEKPRRHNSRDRFRGADADADAIDDYDIGDRRKQERAKARNKSNIPGERRKAVTRRPVAGVARSGGDERRSFGSEEPRSRKDKLRPALDDVAVPAAEPIDSNSRRGLAGVARRRGNEKRPAPTVAADADDLDYYDKPNAHSLHDQEEAADEDAPPSIKTTAKPLEKYITPKASSSSVYARPRAPPRIARPVPVTEKKKFEYSIQKTTATTPASQASALHDDSEDYDQYDEYDDVPVRPRITSTGRRRVVVDDVDAVGNDFHSGRKRTHNDNPLVGRKPTARSTIRKPVTEKKVIPAAAAVADEDYDSIERYENRPAGSRKRPYSTRTRIHSRVSDDVDFVDDDYDDHPVRQPAHRLRPKAHARKSVPMKSRPAVVEVDDEEDLYEAEPEPPLHRQRGINNGRLKSAANAKLRHSPTETEIDEGDNVKLDSEADNTDAHSLTQSSSSPTSKPATTSAPSSTSQSGRHASVRVVKRPFLPSRGGSPYLPRGLQPVGIAHRPFGGNSQATESTPIDMGSTISGVHLLEHGAPLVRDSGNDLKRGEDQTSPRTTLPPRSAIPIPPQPRPIDPQLNNKATLDELYETDYDVTLNDALNPTLKPLSPHPNHHHTNQNHRNYPSAYALSSPGAANSFVNNNNHQHQHQSSAIYSNSNSNNNHNNINNNNENYQSQQQIAYQSLSPSHHQSQHQHHQQMHQQHQQQNFQDNFNSDSYFSSTDIRRRAIVIPAPAPAQQTSRASQYRGVGSRIEHFYDDFEY